MNVTDLNESVILTKYERHRHAEWEIVRVLSGKMQVCLGEWRGEVSEGDVLLIPPGMAHEGCDGERYTDIYLKAALLDFSGAAIVHDYDGSIGTLFSLLNRVLREKEGEYADIADALLLSICEYLRRLIGHEYRYDFVARIKNKIYENYTDSDFSPTREIRAIGYNTDYFRRCFREELGCSPLEYLTRLRISRAKGLLTQRTFESVEKVARLSGFADSFYFSKLFKQHTGLSPREYRRRFGHGAESYEKSAEKN